MSKTNSWEKLNHKDVMEFSKGYIDYLNTSKTERLAVNNTIRIAEEAGFVPFESKESLKPGDRVYHVNRGKNIVLAVIGTNDIDKKSNKKYNLVSI